MSLKRDLLTLRKQRAVAAIFFTLLLLLAVAVVVWRQSLPTILTYVKPDARQVVEKAESVTAYRIQSIRTNENGEFYLTQPLRVSDPVDLTHEQVATLLSALNIHGANNDTPACLPNPGIELVFTRGEKSILLDLCFSCGQATFRDRDRHLVGGCNLSHARKGFVDLVKQLFPSDAAVQDLPEDHGARELEGRPGERPTPLHK